jgi:PAS domain-containing protein
MREIALQHEEHWFEIYGGIALMGEPKRFENEAKQLGRWYDVYAFRVDDPKRRRVGILFNDSTERKCAEKALMRREAYLAEAQKLTHTGSWACDPRTEKVLYCSEEMFRIYGLDPRKSSPSRENFRQQIHPEDRDWVKERFEASLREKADTNAEYRVLLPDGTVRHISASGHPVHV